LWHEYHRQQRQKEQEQREAEQRRKLEETVQCAEFLVTKLEQHLAGQRISASSQKEAIGFLQFHLPELPTTLQQRIRDTLQGFAEQSPRGSKEISRRLANLEEGYYFFVTCSSSQNKETERRKPSRH
jgi:hypothetical protein